MTKRIVTVTHPDGTKKVIIGKEQTLKPIKTREVRNGDRRPKPGTPKISISTERNGYKYGGKAKPKTC